ncbi:MAG: phosphopantothenoylcysteine decarboxylase, partial [Thermoplasmata archaeon]
SSGAMAVALATAAHYRGARVELWLGAHSHPVPSFLPLTRWHRTEELIRMLRTAPGVPAGLAAVWVPAALADFVPEASTGKIPSRERRELTLRLLRAPKVLPEIRRLVPAPALLIGFKLEAGIPLAELLRRAKELREEHGLDYVVANESAALGAQTTSVHLLHPDGRLSPFSGPKGEVGGKLLDAVGRELPRDGRPPTGRGPIPPSRRRSAVPAKSAPTAP